jgi:hypothetical protein
VEPSWTLQELVAEVAARIAALPAPRNGQVRAIPDDRTVRYYATIGLLDRPSAMRGRTALYGRKHVAQVVAIKRLQGMGRSLSEIQALWPTLDDLTLARMSGVALPAATAPAPVRADFWKREPRPSVATEAGAAGGVEDAAGAGAGDAVGDADGAGAVADDAVLSPAAASVPSPALSAPATAPGAPTAGPGVPAAVELRLELAPQVVLSLSIVDESVVLSPADVRALRAAAAPLLAELASRRLAPHARGEEP